MMALKYAPLLLLALFLAACGVKSLPRPADLQNPQPVSLAVRATAQGMEVSFILPPAERPDKAISQVLIKYAYTPLSEDPLCPGCPPVLKFSQVFDLTAEGTPFVWLDAQAPYGLRAVYQATLTDRAGRQSRPSPLASGFMLNLPPSPAALSARTLEDCRELSWQEVPPMEDTRFQSGHIGYLVERSLDGRIERLSDRPLSGLQLRDCTANPSRTYRYRVLSARVLDDAVLALGEPGPWVKAAPFGRQSSLLPPESLVAISVPQGVYLRFEPVADPESQGYLLERRSNDQEQWQPLNSTPQAENTYIDSQVISGHYYQYRVMAVDAEGDLSPPNDAVTVLYLEQERDE